MPSAVYGQQPVKLEGVTLGGTIAVTDVYKFVKFSATEPQVVLCAAVTDIPCGVIQAPGSAGDPAEVVACGLTQLRQDGTITAPGQLIGTGATALGAKYVAGTDTTKYIVGQSKRLAGGTASGNFIEAAINCLNPTRGA